MKKKKFMYRLYRIMNSYIINIIKPIFFVLIIFIIIIIFNNGITWSDLTDVKLNLSLIIPTFFGALTIALYQLLTKRLEDLHKVNFDYNQIFRIYHQEELMELSTNDSVIKIPNINCYENTSKSSVIINHDKNSVYQLPTFFQIHYKDLMKFHRFSKINNNVAIRLNSFSLNDDNNLVLYTGLTTYYNTLVTNRSIDGELQKHMSIRKIFEFGPKLNTLENSFFSNHIGLSVLIITLDDYIMLNKRTGKTSISKRKVASSVSASLKYKYAVNDEGQLTTNGLLKAICREIEDEVGLVVRECNNNFTFEENFLGLARDITEGGKPNLYFYLKVDLTKDEIINIFNSKCKSKNISKYSEVENLLFIREEDLKVYGYYYSKINKKKCELSHELLTSLWYYKRLVK